MKLFKFFQISILLFITSIALAEPHWQRLNSVLANLHSMTADFQQTAILKKGHGRNSSGKMALQRPGKFFWETTTPNHQILIADGKYLWYYDVDLEQASKQRLDRNVHSPAILLSGGMDAIKQRFNLIDAKQTPEGVLFQLRPNSGTDDFFQEVDLTFSKEKLTQLTVIDSLGQKTLFRFSNVKVNPTLPAKLFHFHAPKGVEITQSNGHAKD